MKRTVLLAAALLVTVGFVSVQGAPEEVTLRFKVEPGQKVEYGSTMEFTMEAMGNTINSKMETSQVFDFTKKDEKGTYVSISFKELKLIDDSGLVSDEQRAQIEGVKDQEATELILDEQGLPTVVKQKLEKPNPATTMILSAGGGQSGFFGYGFPKEALKVGSKWQTEVDAAKAFGAAIGPGTEITADKKLPLLNTVEKIEKRGEVVVVTIKSIMDGDTVLSRKDIDTTFNLQVKSECITEVDAATGLVLMAESNMKSTAAVAGLGDLTQSLKTKVVRK